ncbi:peptidyl-tRNA hydrolase 2 like protein [Babesia gibsoni]|uniref:peptidyl-tRNA hydrolase n=1 Tax=Babesia gibsoni TaxID=33632 RepID=A0AAD8LL06_BABGI|nr:peptidyl-tRNA hydrolase 2 like protein [Babesia gibsoni]
MAMLVTFYTPSLVLVCALFWLLGFLSAPVVIGLRKACIRLFRSMAMGRHASKRIEVDEDASEEEYEWDDEEVEVKLVLCVRSDLEMGKGKIAAQCGHAALGAFLDSNDRKNPHLETWLRTGQRKIVVKLKDYEEMASLRRAAIAYDVNYHITCDAGRTQVLAGTQTVIAIGPAPEHIVDKITGHLKLL